MALNSLEMATLGLLGPDGFNSLTMATLGLLRPEGVAVPTGLDPEGDRGTETPPGYDIDGRRQQILDEDRAILKFITDTVTKRLMD